LCLITDATKRPNKMPTRRRGVRPQQAGAPWTWSRPSARDVNPTWWLGLLAGSLEIIIGFWASQQAFPARGALLIFWVGFFALFRGISDIVVAFEVRHAESS
jgi:uncharacterized membrane protein HdeD (DUF308 family)